MNRKERMNAVLRHEKSPETPVGFWLHFPKEAHKGAPAVKAHMDFVRQTDTDILKIMNENVFYDGMTRIYSTADIPKFRGYSRKDDIFRNQMDVIRAVADQAQGDYPIISTIHGLVVSAFHETGFSGNYTSMGYGLAIFCREKPEEMKRVFNTIAESLMELVDCSLEAGADGIFYAALGGDRNFFTDEEFNTFVRPYEQMVYDHIKSRTPLNVLHICKSNIELGRFADLNPAIVNWSIYQNKVSLTEGSKVFPNSVLLGGFQDRSGVLVDGTPDEIRAHTAAVLQEMKDTPFIVGSDCTLPTDIDLNRIRLVVDTVRELEAKNT